MNISLHERATATALVVATAAVVVVLAALQYRWSNQVSDATAVRLADSLQMSMVNWHANFLRDLSEVCIAMPTGSQSGGDLDRYARGLDEWRASTSYPDMVADLYVLDASDPAHRVALRLRHSASHFEAVAWPSRFDPFAAELRSGAAHADGAPAVDEQNDGRAFSSRLYATRTGLSNWRFEPSVPALLHRLTTSDALSESDGSARRDGPAWLLVEIDPGVLGSRVLPDLAKRYFSGTDGLDYKVAVVAGTSPRRVLYTSDADFGTRDVPDADGRMDLFGRAIDPRAPSPIYVFHAPSENGGATTSIGMSWFPLWGEMPASQDWQLVVRHRRGGPLGAFIAEMHRRDLSISFGVLLLLVVSMTMWIVVSNRGQRLARLQMDFVTAVSHELRTPLTIISSAADNIVHGVVQGKSQLTQYGSVIGAQSRRLSGMVEEILLFASIREARQRYSPRPIEVSELVEATLAGSAELIQASQFTVDRDIDPNLPQVMGDPLALSQCLQNLITNALKYGGAANWMGIRAEVADTGNGSEQEIRLSVSDRGMGISATDLPRIFDPFYRSPSVIGIQIHGTGLGLSLARSIAEAMKGRITVVSAPGQGSRFTVHLPCAEPSAERRPMARVPGGGTDGVDWST